MKYLFLMLFCLGCASQHMNNRNKQGVYGTVTEITGNQMPSPDLPKPTALGQPMTATIHFFAPIATTDLQLNEYGLYKPLNALQPIATCTADQSGKFRQALPVGKYSVVVVLKDGWFAHQSDASTIQPVQVTTGKWAEKNIEINYRAAY